MEAYAQKIRELVLGAYDQGWKLRRSPRILR